MRLLLSLCPTKTSRSRHLFPPHWKSNQRIPVQAGMRQKEIAVKLGVSARTLSLWETDRIVPAWAYQPRLIAYLGVDPFDDLMPGSPKRNETSGVAILSPEAPVSIGKKIKQQRLKMRKTRKQLASELGVSPKTLWSWETNRWLPNPQCWKRLARVAFSISLI